MLYCNCILINKLLLSIHTVFIYQQSPVSICMFLVVLLVYAVYNPSAATIQTATNLVYLESPSDSTSEKLEGAVLNAIVFVIIITLFTFLVVLLVYYRFNHFLIYYTRFYVFSIFSTMGSGILISIIQKFSIPIDSITFFVLLFNFTVFGTMSVFSEGIPIVLKQGNMVVLGVIVVAWFTRLPDWTTWVVLVALTLYDLVAVLAPGGPMKLLVQLASTRDGELPALLYDSRPNVGRNSNSATVAASLFAAAAVGIEASGENESGSVELHELLRNKDVERGIEQMGENEIVEVREEVGEMAPLIVERNEDESGRRASGNVSSNSVENGSNGNMEVEMVEVVEWGIKLDMGDFIFYSVLVGRAAMYDLMTVYACYLAIIYGLGCTLILLVVCRRALPALRISVALGVMFYFLTRLLMEPFVVGASTNLLMF